MRFYKLFGNRIFKAVRTLSLLFILSHTTYAQDGEYFITNFEPLSYSSKSYNSSPQNWCIEKDNLGRIFVANQSGIMLYDGFSWSMISNTEDKLFFKFAKDDRETIYTGGQEDLGYFKSDSVGKIEFVSLKEKLPKSELDFGRIFNVNEFNGAIYFRSKSHILRYKDGEFKIWKPRSNFLRLTSSSAGLFISEKDAWYRMRGDQLEDITPSIEFPLPKLKAVLKSKGNSLVVATKSNGLFRLLNNQLTHLPSELDSATIYNACELNDGRFAIATIESGVFVFNSNGEFLSKINENNGLITNSITFSRYRDGELLLATYSGISIVEYPIRTSFYGKNYEVKGLPLEVCVNDGIVHLGTVQGAFELKPGDRKFSIIEGSPTEVFGLVSIGNKLITGGTSGISVWENSRLVFDYGKLIDESCTHVLKSEVDSDVFYAAFLNKVVQYSMKEGYTQKDLTPNSVGHNIYSIAETSSGNLWAAYDGISYIEISKNTQFPVITTLDASHGLVEEMGFIEVSKINGTVVFGTELGAYVFDYQKEKLVPYTRLGKKFSDGSHIAYNLTEMRNGDVWITTNSGTGILRKQSNGTFIYDSLPIIRAPISDVWDIYEDDKGVVWVCGTEAVVKYDPSVEFDYHLPYNAFVRGVVINDKKKIFHGNYSDKNGNPSVKQPKSYIPTLEHSDNNITFEYGAAYYATDQKLDYSVMLVGKDKKWSHWRKATEINYTNLPEGTYTFKVRARNVYGTISEEAEYTFVVLPPWYRTTWAYLGFGVGGLLFILLIVRLNSARLKRDNERLEGLVDERTREVRKQKDEIEEQAKQLQNAYQRLLELDMFKENMTSMIVHDLKNPLNAILNTPIDEADIEQLSRIKQSGRQMLNLVLNILDVYKYENAEMKTDQDPLKIKDVFDRSLTDIGFLAKQQGIQLNVDLPQSVTLNGDKEVLGRVLINLLTNAIKYSPTMSLIEVRGHIVGSNFRIEVEDHGTGIEEKNLEIIFDQFKQIDGVDSGGVKSTGLGLTFCRMAIEAHGGRIGANSVYGKGSTFWLEIPIPEGSDVENVDEQFGNKEAVQLTLSEETIVFLKPFAEDLSNTPYYKISNLREIIQGIKSPENIKPEVEKWIAQFKEAAGLANRELIHKLIRDILDE